jgi:sporulation protein YlmC with PRC-barrel domain
MSADRVFDVRLHLLDRQIVGSDGTPVGTVDDLELVGIEPGGPVDPSRPPAVSALLSGPVLWARIFGGPVRRDHFDEVPIDDVEKVGTVIDVARPADAYPASWPERWVRDRVIGRIPGGRPRARE